MVVTSDLTDVRGSRLFENCVAVSIDANSIVTFVGSNLPDGYALVYCEHRPPGVIKGDVMNLLYVWSPSDAYYVARRK